MTTRHYHNRHDHDEELCVRSRSCKGGARALAKYTINIPSGDWGSKSRYTGLTDGGRLEFQHIVAPFFIMEDIVLRDNDMYQYTGSPPVKKLTSPTKCRVRNSEEDGSHRAMEFYSGRHGRSVGILSSGA